MRTYIVRGYDQDDDYRIAVIVTTPESIYLAVNALRWSQVTEPELVEDHVSRII